jgi:peptidoglycan-associated lipoprotein
MIAKTLLTRLKTGLVLTMTLSLLVGMAGCAGSKKKDEGGGIPSASEADENVAGDSDSNKAMGLQTVHFPYDSSVLDSEAKQTLKANADIMKEKPSLKVQVEGHCDQRGGIQYNIALGEKRAKIAKTYLEDLGIAEDRLTVISFGKEKPIDLGNSDEAYSRNRRDNFVVTSQ